MAYQVFNSINAVPKHEWDALLNGRSCSFSHAFWTIIEKAGLNDFSYRYVIFRDRAGQAIGCATVYSVSTDIAIFAPLRLRSVLERIRAWWPGFLKLRMLECGTPIILNSPGWIAKDQQVAAQVDIELLEFLTKAAKEGGELLIVVRDFENGTEREQAVMAAHGYHLVEGLPNTYLDLPWKSAEAYVASFKSYYRSKLLKYLRRNKEAGITHEVVQNFGDIASVLCKQWKIVHDQADEFQREILTTSFYQQLSLEPSIDARAILFYRHGHLVGHALLLIDGSLGRWLYFGREEAGNDGLYLYVAYAVIETALAVGVSRLEMGLTTYPIKQDLGARVEPIRFAIRSAIGWINPLVGVVYSLLNKPARHANKVVFKSLEGE